jgi:hypothetical protein
VTLTLVLIIFGTAFFLSSMAFGIAIRFRPNIVLITERFVCSAGAKMEVELVKLSYHRPGEKGIVVSCTGQGETQYVNAKALPCLWFIFFVGALPVATLLGVLIWGWIPQ